LLVPLGLLELPAPPGVVGLVDFLLAPLDGDPALPDVPLAPDELLPVAELPPDAEPPSRSHPAIRVPLRANASAAANAVDFMLTSIGLCAQGRARNGPSPYFHQGRAVHR
jgi:hypothetical protein